MGWIEVLTCDQDGENLYNCSRSDANTSSIEEQRQSGQNLDRADNRALSHGQRTLIVGGGADQEINGDRTAKGNYHSHGSLKKREYGHDPVISSQDRHDSKHRRIDDTLTTEDEVSDLTLTSLPCELIQHVASFLNIRDRFNVSRVNRQAYKDLWTGLEEPLDFNKWLLEYNASDDLIALRDRTAPRCRKLIIKIPFSGLQISDKQGKPVDLASILQFFFPNLNWLRILDNDVTFDGLRSLNRLIEGTSAGHPPLRLNLLEIKVMEEPSLEKLAPFLVVLRLLCTTLELSKGIIFPNLVEFHLLNIAKIPTSIAKQLNENWSMPSLKRLAILERKVDVAGFGELMRKLSQLERLVLNVPVIFELIDGHYTTGEFVALLQQLPESLVEVCLQLYGQGSHSYSDASDNNESEVERTELVEWWDRGVTMDFINLPNLKRLYLSANFRVHWTLTKTVERLHLAIDNFVIWDLSFPIQSSCRWIRSDSETQAELCDKYPQLKDTVTFDLIPDNEVLSFAEISFSELDVLDLLDYTHIDDCLWMSRRGVPAAESTL